MSKRQYQYTKYLAELVQHPFFFDELITLKAIEINSKYSNFTHQYKNGAVLAKREVTNEWPEDYFEKLGKWGSETLQRPSQGVVEQREILD